MDINYELYKVFYYVAKTLSFSDASKRLFISQSAVSQSIKALEKKLNQHLFIRSTKRVKLTPEGEVLFKHIEPAVNLIMRGENQILDANALNGGQLRIGASDTSAVITWFLIFRLSMSIFRMSISKSRTVPPASAWIFLKTVKWISLLPTIRILE